MQTRKKAFLCNMFIIALCLTSILAYFIMPFWRVNVKYTVTAETLESILPTSSGDESNATDDILGNLNIAELIDGGITLSLAIELQTADILGAMGPKADMLVKTILNNNVNSIIAQIDPVINDMVKKIVKTVVKDVFVSELKTKIKENLTENLTDEEITKELEEIGLSEEDIDQKANQLVDAVYAENATVESVVDETIDIVKDSIQNMQASGKEEYANVELTPEAEAELREQIASKLQDFTQEDGVTLDPEGFTADFLLDMLKESTETPPEDTARVSLAKPLSANSNLSAEEKDAKKELKELLTDKLMELIGDAADIIATALNVICYVILFTFFTWAYLIIKILAKLKKPNNTIKLKLPIWLGSLPYIVLCLIPTVALKAASGALPSELDALVITFSSCSIVSFIIGIVLAVFSIVYYGGLRKTLKNKAAFWQERAAENVESQDNLLDESQEAEGILPPLE